MGLADEDLIVQDGGSEESNVESEEESDEASDEAHDEESELAPDDDFEVEESDNNPDEESGDSEASENEEGENENSGVSDENDEEEDHKNDGNEASEEEDEEGNVGWADAMAKVLAIGKNTDKPISVLSKAKKDNVKKKKKVKPEGDTTGDANDSDEDPILEPLAVRKARKKELDSIGRTRPDVLQKNAEKVLTKIATRGVVQLFNAVREQQKDLKSKLREAGGSFRKQEKVFKNIDKDSFVDILTGGKEKPVTDLVGGPPASKKPKTEVKDEEDAGVDKEQSSSWNILRDDFMLGAKMRDWDKDSDGE